MKGFIFALLLLVSPALAEQTIPEHLQAISVTVRAGGSSGSGVIKTRDGVHYVWTAGHVVDGLRKTREILVDGSKRTVVEFSDPKVVQKITDQTGKIIGEFSLDCEVLRFSGAEKQDLALLRIRKRDFLKDSVTFHITDDNLAVGTELYHVGSLLGDFGSNSLTDGIISQNGRLLFDGIEFVQTTATAYPGSSGGGIFTKADGKYCAMLVRGSGESYNLAIPVHRMKKWAAKSGIMFAMDDSVAVPSEEELDKLPIDTDGEGAAGDAPHAHSLEYPVLLHRPSQ